MGKGQKAYIEDWGEEDTLLLNSEFRLSTVHALVAIKTSRLIIGRGYTLA